MAESYVLVLNQGFEPIGLRKLRKVLNKCILREIEGKVILTAEIVSAYADRKIPNSWSGIEHVPAVIRLLHFMYPPEGVSFRGKKFNRKNLWERDGHICSYCSKKLKLSEVTFDHVVPKSQGGKCVWTNIVCACADCNLKKSDKTPDQAGMTLVRRPFIPKNNMDYDIKHFLKSLKENISNMTGQPWIDYLYQNVELIE
jgi:hypothetical protein